MMGVPKQSKLLTRKRTLEILTGKDPSGLCNYANCCLCIISAWISDLMTLIKDHSTPFHRVQPLQVSLIDRSVI